MTPTDTPRTDAETEYYLAADMSGEVETVPADFARGLERELAEMHRDCMTIVAHILKRNGKDVTNLSVMDRLAELHKAELDLAAERALADRLAETMRQIADGCNDAWCRDDATVALAAWKEARRA